MLLRVRTALRVLGVVAAVLALVTLAASRFPSAQRLPRFVVMQPLAFSVQALRTQRIVGLRFGQQAWYLPGPLVLPFHVALGLLALGWVWVELGTRRWSSRWPARRAAASAPAAGGAGARNGATSPPRQATPRPANPAAAPAGAATLVPIPAEADELERAITRLEVGDPRGAIAILEPLERQGKNKELVRYYLVFAYAKDQQPDKVRAAMVSLNAGGMPAARRYKLAVALDQARLYDLALALYEQLLPEHPRFSQVVERHKRVREIMFEGGAEAFDRQLVAMLDRRYSNAKVMAAGGMGVVFSAWEDDPGRTVAIKMLSPFMRNDEEAVKRFLLEGRTLKELDHANLVRTYQVHTAPCPHYSMELLAGMTLAEVISRQSPIPPARIKAYGLQLLAGLAYCHERGVLHRDIKPANVLVPDQGPLKIIDFGLVRLSESTGITVEGTVLGTPAYMPPEQLKGLEVDLTADLYSFGVCLYELATGRLPFPVGDQMTAAIQNGTFTPAAAFRHELPPELDALLARLIRPDREGRPRSAGEVAQMLSEALPG